MREVSHIHTAPASRLPVATAILPWDPSEVQAALRQELQRGGQAFYVVPRIRDIPLHVEMLTELLKGARRDGVDPGIVVAHGGLPPGQAEEVLVRFAMRGPRSGDVLVATTLIENGLDVPTVNTVVVAQAHKLGLASLYQLRGRVGRSDKQAYAYFFHPVQQEKNGGGKDGKGKEGAAAAAAAGAARRGGRYVGFVHAYMCVWFVPCIFLNHNTNPNPHENHSGRSAWDDEDEEEEEDTTVQDNKDLLASDRLSPDPETLAKQIALLGGASMTGEAVQRLAALKVRGLGGGGRLLVALAVAVALPFLSLVG